MTNLPKPSFATEKDQLAGGEALMKAGDTTRENVEKAVPLGELVWDSDLVHVRYLVKGEDLLYHVFRGEKIPEKFWGQGEFGVCLLRAAEANWHMDTPKVSFQKETCRQEVYADDPREPSKYPPHFYGAYLVAVLGAGERMVSEVKIKKMCEILESDLEEAVDKWSNGS
jgi:hypothetical protein